MEKYLKALISQVRLVYQGHKMWIIFFLFSLMSSSSLIMSYVQEMFAKANSISLNAGMLLAHSADQTVIHATKKGNILVSSSFHYKVGMWKATEKFFTSAAINLVGGCSGFALFILTFMTVLHEWWN